MKKILWSASFVLVLFALTFAVAHAEDEKGEKKSDKPTLASFPEAVQKAGIAPEANTDMAMARNFFSRSALA